MDIIQHYENCGNGTSTWEYNRGICLSVYEEIKEDYTSLKVGIIVPILFYNAVLFLSSPSVCLDK